MIKYTKHLYLGQGLDNVAKAFMLLFFYSSLVDHLVWMKYKVQWNVSVIINETIKEYNRLDKFLIQYPSCLKTIWELSLFLCQNNNILLVEEVIPFPFFCNIGQTKSVFVCISSLIETA